MILPFIHPSAWYFIVSIEGKAITYILQALKTAFINGLPFSFFFFRIWNLRQQFKKMPIQNIWELGDSQKDIPTP